MFFHEKKDINLHTRKYIVNGIASLVGRFRSYQKTSGCSHGPLGWS